MFITGTRLRTKIGGTSVNEMRIFTSKGEELDNTTSHDKSQVTWSLC